MDAHLCTYCAELPVLDRDRRGVKSRCPLCKTDSLRTDSGEVYRYSGDLPNHAGALPVAAWVAGGLAAAILATTLTAAGIWFAPTRPAPTITSRPVASAAAVATVVLVDEPSLSTHRAGALGIGLAKPSVRPPREEAKPFAYPEELAAPELYFEPLAAPRRLPDFWTRPRLSEDELRTLAEAMPEAGLVEKGKYPVRDWLKDMAARINKQNAAATDGFITELRKERADLAGLPFLMGDACRLSGPSAAALAKHSFHVNTALSDVRDMDAPGLGELFNTKFWSAYRDVPRPGLAISEGAAALEQILSAQPAELRRGLVEKAPPGDLTRLLVRRALFDFDPAVRKAAVEALHSHSLDECAKLLMDGFRYPWPPVARHAAEALVALDATAAVPALEDLLREPDPFVTHNAEESRTFVREVVRVNHFKNCVLCHVPAQPDQVKAFFDGVRHLRHWRNHGYDLKETVIKVPVGATPTAERFPQIYYQGGSGDVFVRADITYLRQDFSVMIETPESPRGWPDSHRYDFLVRNRAMTDAEVERGWSTLEHSANGEALAFAIARLKSR